MLICVRRLLSIIVLACALTASAAHANSVSDNPLAQTTTPKVYYVFACNTDADCVLTIGGCKNLVAVNKRYKEQFDKAEAHDVSCMGGSLLFPNPIAVCNQGQCTVKSQQDNEIRFGPQGGVVQPGPVTPPKP